MATRLAVDLTAVAAWEAGKYLPRANRRVRLASLLEIDVATLFAEEQQPTPTGNASLVDTLSELPGLLRELLSSTQRRLKAFRLSAPYCTPAHVQEEFRSLTDKRLQDGSLEVQRIEIFYDLNRLKEVLSNMLRHEGRAYSVKAFCVGQKEVVPGIGGYLFDDHEVLIGAHWTEVSPVGRPGLHLRGEPFNTYFGIYWDEIWQHGTALNAGGKPSLPAVRDVALALGLKPQDWPQFLAAAQALEVGDGLPPLI